MDSSRRHVRGDEHLELAPLEAPERCLAFWLAQLGRERAGTHSVPAEELSDEADSFDLVGEDEDAPLVMLVAVIVAATLASACAELAMTVVALWGDLLEEPHQPTWLLVLGTNRHLLPDAERYLSCRGGVEFGSGR